MEETTVILINKEVLINKEAKRETETEILEEQLELDFDYDTYGGGSENFGKN